MLGTVLLLVALGYAATTPTGTYHQEYTYKSSSSSFKNNELQHKTDDQGYYKKDGDLEGRTKPRIDANNEHSEYVNPNMNSNRYTGYGDSTDMNSYGHLNAQSGVSGYGTNNLAEGIASSDRIIGSRGYSGSGSYGASNYGSSNYGSSQYGSGSYGSDSYGSAGYGSSGYRTNSYGSSSTSIQSVIQRLQQDFERELQNHRWRDAYSQANVDRADLERQFRQNLTERLNSELLNRYGQQTIRNGMSYSISGGQVQSNANYDNQELTSLKQQLENSLINRLRNQYNQGYGTSGGSSHYQSQSESHTNYGYSSSTVRPAYQTLYPSLPIYQTTARTSYSQSNYDVINSNVRYTPVRNPEPISNIASSVQSQLDATLNQVLDEIQRKYFATSSSYQLTNYDVVLNRLQDELRNNITYLIDDNLRRNYGSQSQRDGYLYSIGPSGQISNDHNYALRDLETLKSQVERNLLEKLNREFNTYRTRYSSQSHSYNSQSNYNNYVTSPAIVYTTPRAQYSSGIKGGSIQNNYGYTAGSRQSGYEYSGGSHSGGSSYTSGTYGTADLSSLQSQLQEELSRQLQAAIRRDSSSSSSYGSYSPQNYQSSLQHLTDELNRNVSRHLQEYSASASYSASGDYDQGQIDNLKSQLLASLTSQLQQNLRQHFQSGSASSSSSYSASSSNANYRPVRAFQNNQQGQYRAGGSVTIGEECDDGPVNSYRMKRSPYEPYRSQPLSYYQSSSHSQQGYGYSGSHGHRYFGSHTYGGSSLSSNQHTGQEEDDTEVGQQEELGQEIEQEEQYVPSQHLQPKPLKFQEEPTSQTNGFHHTGQQESVDDVGQQVVEEEYENLHVGQQSEVGQQPDDGDVTALDLHHQTGQEEDNSELVGTLVHSPIQNEQHSVQTSSSQLHFLNTGFNKWRGNQGVEHVNNVNLNQQPEDIELGQQVETDLDSSKLTREEPLGQEVGQEQDDSDLTQQIEEFDHSGQQVVQDNVGQEVDGSAVYSTPVGHGVVSQQGSSLFSVTSHRRPGSFYQTNSGQSSSVQGGLSSGIQFSHSGNFNRNYHSGSSGFSVGVESRPLTWESIVIQRGVNSNGGHGITYWLSHDWKPSQEQLFEKSKQTLVRKLDESLSNAQTLHRKKDEILKEIARNLTQDFSLYNDDYLTKQLGFTYEEIEGLKAAVFENLRKELETKTQVINLPTQNVFESSHGSSVVSQYPSQPESEIPTANVYQGQEIDEGQQVEQDENEQDLVGGHGISFWLSRKWKPAQEPFIERVKLALMDQLDSTLKTARQYHLKKEEILRSLTISFKNDFSLYSDDYLRNQLGFTIEEIEGVRASILENLRRELDKRTQNIHLQTQTVLDSSSQGSSEVNQHPIQQWPEIPAANLHQGQQTENEWPNVKPDEKSYFGSSSQNEQDLIWLSRKWKPAQEPFIERLKLALMDKLDSTLKTARQYHLKKEEILRSLTISFKNDFSLYSDDYLRNQLGFTVEEIQGVKASILENLRTEVDKRTQNMNLQTQSVSSWNQHSSVLNHYPDQQKPAIPSGNVYVEQETDDGEQHVEQPANSYFTSSSHNVVNPIGGHNIQYWLSHDWKPSQDRFIERTKQRLLNKLDESLKTTVTLHRKKDEILEELAANLTKYFSLYNDDYFTTHLELTHDEIEGIKATILENVRKELDKKTSTGQTLTGVEFGQENLLTQTPNHDNSPIPSANLHLGQEPDNVGQHVEQASSSLHVPAVNYRKPVQTEIGQEVDDSDLTQQTEEFENLHTGQQEFNEPIGQTVDQDVGQTLEQDLENVGQTLDETDVHSVVPLSHSTNSNQLGFSQTKVVDLSGWNEKQQRFIKQLDGRLIGELSGSIGINHVQNYDSEEFNRELTVKVKNALKNYNQYFFLNYLGLKKDQLNDFETTILEYLRTEWQKTVQTSSVNVHQTGVVFNPQEPVVQEEAIQPQHIPATGGLSLQKSEEPPQVSEEPLNNVAGNAHQSGGLETTHRQTYSYNSRAEGHYGGSQGNVGVGAQVQYPYRKPARLPDSSSFINTEIGQQENNAQAGTYFSPTLTKVLAEDEQKPSSSVESSQSSVGSSNLNQESHNGNQNTGGVSRVTLQKSTGQWFGLSSQGEFATGQQSRSSAESTADALVESLRQRQTKPQVQVVEQTGESEIPANNNRGYAGYGVHQTSDDSANSRGYGHGSGYHGSSSSSFHFSGSASSGGRLNYGRQHEQEDNLETTGNINAIETGRAHAVVHQNSYQPSHPYSGVKGHRQRPYASYGSSEPGNPGYVGQSMHDPPPPEHPAVVAQEAHSSSSPPPEVTSHIYIEPTVSNEEDLPWWKKVGNKVKQGAAKVKEGAVNLKKKIVG